MAKKTNKENAVIAEDQQPKEVVEVVEQPKEEKAVEAPKAVEPAKPQKGILFSRLDYQEEYQYDGQTCMITPKGKITVEDVNKLAQPLKPGLILRKID